MKIENLIKALMLNGVNACQVGESGISLNGIVFHINGTLAKSETISFRFKGAASFLGALVNDRILNIRPNTFDQIKRDYTNSLFN